MQVQTNETKKQTNGKRGRPLSDQAKHARSKLSSQIGLIHNKFTAKDIAARLKVDQNTANNAINYLIEQKRIIKLDEKIHEQGKRGRPQCVYMKAPKVNSADVTAEV